MADDSIDVRLSILRTEAPIGEAIPIAIYMSPQFIADGNVCEINYYSNHTLTSASVMSSQVVSAKFDEPGVYSIIVSKRNKNRMVEVVASRDVRITESSMDTLMRNVASGSISIGLGALIGLAVFGLQEHYKLNNERKRMERRSLGTLLRMVRGIDHIIDCEDDREMYVRKYEAILHGVDGDLMKAECTEEYELRIRDLILHVEAGVDIETQRTMLECLKEELEIALKR